MDHRTLGLVLIWCGALLLAGVLLHRIRSGAWSPEAFDEAPPVNRWPIVLAVCGGAAALSGVGLMAWDFL